MRLPTRAGLGVVSAGLAVTLVTSTASAAPAAGAPGVGDPSNDQPTDKAGYDVAVEVPDNLVALSNGTLVRTSRYRPGWTWWRWRSTQPQNTYATTLEVGAFQLNQSATPDGKPFITAYD